MMSAVARLVTWMGSLAGLAIITDQIEMKEHGIIELRKTVSSTRQVFSNYCPTVFQQSTCENIY